MDKQYKIAIPEPCHQDWNKMSPKDNGRFCLSCSKTVVDFTLMLPEEIQHFFIQNQGSKICGRFKTTQLDDIIIQIPSRILYSQNHYHKIFLLALFVAMGTILFCCQDKDGKKHKIHKEEIVEDNLTKNNVSIETDTVSKNDCKQNPLVPPLPKKVSQKDPEIFYSKKIGEVVVEDVINNADTIIDYDALFATAYLEVKPFPEGGFDKFYSFLKTNYVVPDKTEKYSSKIYTSFVIEKDGTLSTFKIIRDAGQGTGEEAIRVLKMAPKWIPGKLNNHIVRSTFMLPISLK
jgi:hypothetical protein